MGRTNGDIEHDVLIRSPLPSDRDAFVDLRTRNLAFLTPWEPAPPGGKISHPAKTFERYIKLRNTKTTRRFFVVRRSDRALMGQIGLSQIFRGPFQNAIVGYWIGEEFAGKGYMRAALSLLLDLSFGPMKLHRIEANMMPRNTPSRALARSVGMRFEGLALRYLQIQGVWEDHEHWAITAEVWKELREGISKRQTSRGARTMSR